MYIEDRNLKNEELVSFNLRNIYRKYGYSCFKMSKFEEYDLYSNNKDFLISDSVITFTDTNGKLMALKPDVTLSIVKNYKDSNKGIQRVYYNENVYRISDKTHQYKEIMQVGLECIGNIDLYNIYEVVGLAAESLKSISDNAVLNISHLGILSELFSGINLQPEKKNEIIKCVGQKNPHGVGELCELYNVPEKAKNMLIYLATAYGNASDVLSFVRGNTDNKNIKNYTDELVTLANQISRLYNINIHVDLSLIYDMNYYNGIVFQGFIEGVPTGVLSGGQYDNLMTKVGHKAKAIGFAVYIDLLERIHKVEAYTVDILLLYTENDNIHDVQKRVSDIISEGKSVSAQTVIPDNLNYRGIEYFNGGENQ